MSSYLPLPGLQQNTQVSGETGVSTLWGSFQLPATYNGGTLASQFRGSGFSAVTYAAIGTGVTYNVLVNLPVSNSLVPVQAVGNGQPNGLLSEPEAWLVYEQIASAATTPPFNLSAICTKYDPVTASFNICLYNAASAALTTAQYAALFTNSGAQQNFAVNYRVQFAFSWKTVSFLP